MIKKSEGNNRYRSGEEFNPRFLTLVKAVVYQSLLGESLCTDKNKISGEIKDGKDELSKGQVIIRLDSVVNDDLRRIEPGFVYYFDDNGEVEKITLANGEETVPEQRENLMTYLEEILYQLVKKGLLRPGEVEKKIKENNSGK